MNSRGMGFDGRNGRPPAGLARQSSIYTLTFDEFQNTLGGVDKDFGSMNMDELLKNIWTAEGTQAMTAASLAEGGGGGVTVVSSVGSLQRQESLALPRTLSRKTVDEVWRYLFTEESDGVGGQVGAAGAELQPHRRQTTLGETTLEEFLMRAGVVRADVLTPAPRQTIIPANTVNCSTSAGNHRGVPIGIAPDNQADNTSPSITIGFTAAARGGGQEHNPSPSSLPAAGLMTNIATVGPPIQLGRAPELASQSMFKAGGEVMGLGDPVVNSGLMPPGIIPMGAGGVTVATLSPGDKFYCDSLGRGNGELDSLSPVPYVFNGGGLRGRRCGGGLEKVVERRQRRMIKNRESAARSRARKQAYTMELETEVAQLKEKNQELQKRQVEILEMQKAQIMEMISRQHGCKRRCLRRTHTGPW